MTAVLLFSALVHVAAVALAAALALQVWAGGRSEELRPPEFASIAAKFGGVVGVVAAVLTWLFQPFGHALAAGLGVGLLAALMLVLFLAVRPMAPSPQGRPWHTRPHSLLFLGTFATMELFAFVFLLSRLGNAAASG